MKKIVSAVLMLTVVFTSIFLYQKYRIAPGIKFETLELTDISGKDVKLGNYHNKKLFLNFFASWCGSCITEFPALDSAAGLLIPDNFLFIAISDDPLPVLNRVYEHVNTKHIIFLHSAKKLKDLGVFTYPTSYLLNNKGNVVFKKTGEQNWAQPEIINDLKQKAD